MNTEPQLNLTPYSVVMALTAVLAILASPTAASVVSAQVQQWCSLLSIVLPALTAVLFVFPKSAQRFSARFTRNKGVK